MCTAVSLRVNDCYFGRNLDYFHTFGECIAITPRKYKFHFRTGEIVDNHYAMIGMAVVNSNFPLYFDATNEMGLSIAGLNFPDNAKYNKSKEGMENIASFEFIPWILSRCTNVEDAEKLLSNTNITDEAFSEQYSPTPLHWLISDKTDDITVEQTIDGLKVYKNPVGVLTNCPEFRYQIFNLNNYMKISAKEPENLFSDKLELKRYSLGMGGMGLPGDLSSVSRFVRAAFMKLNSVCERDEISAVSQFFHILYSVYQPRGCSNASDGYEMTNYSSCCNINKGIYYYTTYKNFNINCVDMFKENIYSQNIITHPVKSYFN